MFQFKAIFFLGWLVFPQCLQVSYTFFFLLFSWCALEAWTNLLVGLEVCEIEILALLKLFLGLWAIRALLGKICPKTINLYFSLINPLQNASKVGFVVLWDNSKSLFLVWMNMSKEYGNFCSTRMVRVVTVFL